MSNLSRKFLNILKMKFYYRFQLNKEKSMSLLAVMSKTILSQSWINVGDGGGGCLKKKNQGKFVCVCVHDELKKSSDGSDWVLCGWEVMGGGFRVGAYNQDLSISSLPSVCPYSSTDMYPFQ